MISPRKVISKQIRLYVLYNTARPRVSNENRHLEWFYCYVYSDEFTVRDIFGRIRCTLKWRRVLDTENAQIVSKLYARV